MTKAYLDNLYLSVSVTLGNVLFYTLSIRKEHRFNSYALQYITTFIL
nr:MAG TPA: hypothetical protein [Caudoviricetes sp.]